MHISVTELKKFTDKHREMHVYSIQYLSTYTCTVSYLVVRIVLILWLLSQCYKCLG